MLYDVMGRDGWDLVCPFSRYLFVEECPPSRKIGDVGSFLSFEW